MIFPFIRIFKGIQAIENGTLITLMSLFLFILQCMLCSIDQTKKIGEIFRAQGMHATSRVKKVRVLSLKKKRNYFQF